jgi:hypothetical protein
MAVLLFVSGASYACKDFLNNPPQGALDEGTLSTLEGLEGSLLAVYRALDHNYRCTDNWSHSASDWVFGSVTGDEAYKGSEASDQPAVTDIELYNWTTGAADGYLNGRWSCLYDGVARANATINLLNKIATDRPGEISAADSAGIAGEALFLRGHFHFELWRMFGNIAYYTEDDFDFRESNTGQDVVTDLLADFTAASNLLPATPRNGEAGRVTSWAAEAYKGKVQVYAEQWGGAVATLSNVVNAGPYDLEATYNEVYTGYQSDWNGPETVLAFQASANDGESDGNNANFGERLNHPHGGPFGCCGFHQPTQTLVNMFRVDPGTGLPWALTNADWNTAGAEVDAAASSAGGIAHDPRLDWTVGRDGVPYKDWGVHEQSWIRQVGFGGPYSPKKAIYEQNSGAKQNAGGWFPNQQSSMNMHILRYADVLLLLAEAHIMNGNPGNAEALVNQIRQRAAAGAQGPGTSAADMVVDINDASITWADYEIGLYPASQFANPTDAMTAVRYERMLELAMEGERFYDLRRWGLAQQTITDYLAQETANRVTAEGDTFAKFLSGAAPWTAKYDLYPIPITQLELSRITDENGNTEDRLTQNPGW